MYIYIKKTQFAQESFSSEEIAVICRIMLLHDDCSSPE